MNHMRYRRVKTSGLLVCLLALTFAGVAGTAFSQEVKPLTDADVEKIPAGSQPIKFSHKIHAGQDQINCQYCHVYARRSQVSGVPPVSICVGCHRFIASNLKEVQKVLKYWEDQEPIPWVKIHDIPDFVVYTHDKHVTAKNEVYPNGVPCQECHGPVETMDVVEKVDPNFGKMGWCLSCHLKIPGTLERKRAIAAGFNTMELKNFKHPSGDYARPMLSDCLTCHN